MTVPVEPAGVADGQGRSPGPGGARGGTDRERDRARLSLRSRRRRDVRRRSADTERPRPARRRRPGVPARHAARRLLSVQARAGPRCRLFEAVARAAPGAAWPHRRLPAEPHARAGRRRAGDAGLALRRGGPARAGRVLLARSGAARSGTLGEPRGHRPSAARHRGRVFPRGNGAAIATRAGAPARPRTLPAGDPGIQERRAQDGLSARLDDRRAAGRRARPVHGGVGPLAHHGARTACDDEATDDLITRLFQARRRDRRHRPPPAGPSRGLGADAVARPARRPPTIT